MDLTGLSLVILKCKCMIGVNTQNFSGGENQDCTWRLISTKRNSCWGHPGVQGCSAELVLESGEPLPRLSPAVSRGGTGQCPHGLPGTLRELACQKPHPQPGGTLTSQRARPPDIVCFVTRSSTSNICTRSPGTPGTGMGRVSSSPAPVGITLGHAGHRHCALAASKKKNPTNFQKLSCVWSVARTLFPLLGAGDVTSGSCALFWAPALGGMGKLEPGSVRWSSSCCCLKGDNRGDGTELPGCRGH